MKLIILISFLFAIANSAFSASFWPSGTNQETFSGGIKFGTGITFDSVSTAPNLVARTAQKGSLLSNGFGLYRKNDNGSTTNWTDILSLLPNQNVSTTGSPLFVGVTATSASTATLNVSSLTASSGVRTDASKNLVSGLDQLQVQSLGGADSPTEKIYTNKNQTTDLGSNQKLLEFGNDNILANADFEGAVAGTSWTSATGALARNATQPLKGLYSLQVALTAQTLDLSQTVASSSSVGGIQAEASIWLKGSTAGDVVYVGPKIDGTNSSTSLPITLTTKWQQAVIPFVTGEISNGLFAKTLGNVTNNISFDNAKAKLGEVKQTFNETRFFGSLKWEHTASCIWETTSGTFSDFGADADCDDNARVARGGTSSNTSAGHADGQKPQIKFAYMPAGTYRVVVKGQIGKGSTSGNLSLYRFFDGVNATAEGAQYNTTSNDMYMPMFEGEFHYSSPQNNVTINFQSDANSLRSMIDIASTTLEISVYYYPSNNVSTYSQASNTIIVDANVGGASITLTDSATPLEMTNSNLDLVNNNIATQQAKIACANGTAPSGLTCSSNESVGFSFVAEGSTTYEICASYNIALVANAGTPYPQSGIRIYEVNTAGTVIQEGRDNAINFAYRAGLAVDVGSTFNNKNCAWMQFSSSGEKIIKLLQESDYISYSQINMSRDAAHNAPDAHFTVERKTNLITGTFANVVTIPGVGSPQIRIAEMDASGNVIKELGNLVDGNCVLYTTGHYYCNLTPNGFSTDVMCSSVVTGGVSSYRTSVVGTQNKSIVYYNTGIDGVAFGAAPTTLTCAGY